MSKNTLVIAIIVIVVAVAGYLLLFRNTDENIELTAPQSQTNQSELNQAEAIDQEFPSEQGPKLYIGDEQAPVVITEFIDYKCPNCNTFHRTVKNQIEEEYGQSVLFEIHQTPFIGPDSGRAARGAYCSGIHGSVFEGYNDGVFTYMYDNFYAESNFAAEYEDVLTADILATTYSQAGGSDEEAFRECIEDTEQINLYINADQLLAAEKEVRGTPSFVIGDTSLAGPQQYSVFKALIEAEL